MATAPAARPYWGRWMPKRMVKPSSLTDAELVALGIGHQDPLMPPFRNRLWLRPGGAEGLESGRFGLDVVSQYVEVHAVLGRLWFVHPLQDDRRPFSVGGLQSYVLTGRAAAGVAQDPTPEAGPLLRGGAVEDQLHTGLDQR